MNIIEIEPKALNSVYEFHEVFHQNIEFKPIIPNKKRCELRIALIQEELDELKAAFEANNIVEVFDALADLQYVLSGTVIEVGGTGIFKKIFDEVHRSNMSKACKTEDEANDTVNHYLNKGVEADYEESNGVWLVYRTSDRKTLKSINYLPAKIAEILQNK